MLNIQYCKYLYFNYSQTRYREKITEEKIETTEKNPQKQKQDIGKYAKFDLKIKL